jgi:hypothetical protein
MIDLGLTKRQAKQALPILIGAKKLLVTKGWCQGVAWEDNDGGQRRKDKFCASEAINEAAGRKVSRFADNAMNEVTYTKTGLDTIEYNDTTGRRKSSVIAMLNRTIKEVQQVISR